MLPSPVPPPQAPQRLLPTGSVLPAHPVARPVGTAARPCQRVRLRPGSGLVEPAEPHWHAGTAAAHTHTHTLTHTQTEARSDMRVST